MDDPELLVFLIFMPLKYWDYRYIPHSVCVVLGIEPIVRRQALHQVSYSPSF